MTLHYFLGLFVTHTFFYSPPQPPQPPQPPSYFFLEFSTREGAETAVATGNGYRLDKAHVFAINFFSDFDKSVSATESVVSCPITHLYCLCYVLTSQLCMYYTACRYLRTKSAN